MIIIQPWCDVHCVNQLVTICLALLKLVYPHYQREPGLLGVYRTQDTLYHMLTMCQRQNIFLCNQCEAVLRHFDPTPKRQNKIYLAHSLGQCIVYPVTVSSQFTVDIHTVSNLY